MKILKPIIALVTTLLLVFAISFLLDITIIKQNWLRYAVVVILGLSIAIVGGAVTWQFIKDLKQPNHDN